MSDFNNIEEIREFLLQESLPDGLCLESERRGNSLYIPSLETTITPGVHQPQGVTIGIDFDMYSNMWDKQMYEYSGAGAKDLKTAVSMASSMFLFCFMNGYKRICNNESQISLSTEFAGKKHNWNVVVSDLASLGQSARPDTEVASIYWEPLKEGIIKRLGNQRLVYVKVYAAKFPDKAIGEVRFDDVEIPELSAIVKGMAEQWGETQFASDKQFFFIAQDPNTVVPSLYDGRDGYRKMRSLVVEYLKLFEGATTPDLYDRLCEDAEFMLGDITLAAECYNFLPEIAAIHALGDRISVSDKIRICFPNGRINEVYVSQLTDYAKLDTCLGDIIRRRDFGDETDNLWKDLVGCSSICSALHNAMNAGSKMENLRLTSMIYNVSDGFEIR